MKRNTIWNGILPFQYLKYQYLFPEINYRSTRISGNPDVSSIEGIGIAEKYIF